MIVKTTRLGDVIVEEENIIKFNPGLLAFEDFTRFVLLDIPENINFKWLQSIENNELRFLLVDPFTIKEDYCVELSDEIVEQIGNPNRDDVFVYTTVTVPKSGFKDATTNLVGPLVINWRKKQARQIIYEEGNNSIKYPLFTKDFKKLSNVTT